MAFSVVVLPAPLEPSSATILPASTSQRNVGDADQIAVAHFEMLDDKIAHLASFRLLWWPRPR